MSHRRIGSLVVVGMMAAPLMVAASCKSSGAGGGAGAPLIVQTSEPPGTQCTYGGVKITVGADQNADGVLQPSEVSSVDYVCNGAPGSAGDAGASGQAGQVTLVRLDVEPPGPHCAEGGTAIKSGVDLNHDGVLQDGEVTSTSYACNAPPVGGGLLVGSFTIHNSLDVTFLSGFTGITGDLDIDAPGLPIISLPGLTKIGGALQATGSGAPDLVTLSLPALASLGTATIDGDFPVLATMSMPVLTSTGSFMFGGSGAACPPLASLDLPSLATASGSFTVGCDNATFPPGFSVNAPKLDAAGDVVVSLQSSMAVHLPALKTAKGLTVGGPPSASFSVPALISIGADGLSVVNGVSIDAPVLASSAGPLTLNNGATLVNLPKLASCGDINIGSSIGPAGIVITLPVLTTAGQLWLGDPYSQGKNGPWTLSLPVLMTLAGLDLAGPYPGDISMPSLTTISPGGITIKGSANPADMVTSVLSLPKLHTVSGDLSVTGYAPAGGSLSLPALVSVGGNLRIGAACTGPTCMYCGATTNLALLQLPSLLELGATNTGALTIGREPDLHQSCVQGLVQQLQQAGWTGSSSLPPCTLAAGTCP